MKTIVTSELPADIATRAGIKIYDVLTGFKFIGGKIRDLEGVETFIAGGEESYGYMIGDFVRDKDGVAAITLVAEAAAWARETMGITLYEWLQQLYVKYGFFREGLVNVVRKGKDGAAEIQQMMVDYRQTPPKSLLGSPIVKILDYKTLEELDVKSGEKRPIEGIDDKSNVLQWITEDGTKVSVRPSGTETSRTSSSGAT